MKLPSLESPVCCHDLLCNFKNSQEKPDKKCSFGFPPQTGVGT